MRITAALTTTIARSDFDNRLFNVMLAMLIAADVCIWIAYAAACYLIMR